jgi:2-iminobutanoate/2-iminopropanoate deaminase
MTKEIIKPSAVPAPVGPYNHAVRIGDLLLCSGQIPRAPATGNLVGDDVRMQTGRVLENVQAILADQGLTFANVVKSTVFMTNLGDFAAMNEVYARYFTKDFRRVRQSSGSAATRREVELEVWRTTETCPSVPPAFVAIS